MAQAKRRKLSKKIVTQSDKEVAEKLFGKRAKTELDKVAETAIKRV